MLLVPLDADLAVPLRRAAAEDARLSPRRTLNLAPEGKVKTAPSAVRVRSTP